MMKSPKLSFCTTNYNCAHALKQHLNSIYCQFDAKDFEYIVVDNISKDDSLEILKEFNDEHKNMKVFSQRCTMGKGRQIAFEHSMGEFIIIVDTDTVYYRILGSFIDMCKERYPGMAVQAIYCGIFPREIWNKVGGRGDFNTGEDLDMWMRIWKLGKMRWYPVEMGENIKEEKAKDGWDFLSIRYTKLERIIRLLRREYDNMRLEKFRKLSLSEIWKSNSIDLGLGEMNKTWFGEDERPALLDRAIDFARSIIRILKQNS